MPISIKQELIAENPGLSNAELAELTVKRYQSGRLSSDDLASVMASLIYTVPPTLKKGLFPIKRGKFSAALQKTNVALEAARKDGWIDHPSSEPHMYKGQEVKAKCDVAEMFLDHAENPTAALITEQ